MCLHVLAASDDKENHILQVVNGGLDGIINLPNSKEQSEVSHSFL